MNENHLKMHENYFILSAPIKFILHRFLDIESLMIHLFMIIESLMNILT